MSKQGAAKFATTARAQQQPTRGQAGRGASPSRLSAAGLLSKGKSTDHAKAAPTNDRPARRNAWRGRKGHRRDAGFWLWEIHKQVPIWEHQWKRAVSQLKDSGHTRYRGVWIKVAHVLEAMEGFGQRPPTPEKPSKGARASRKRAASQSLSPNNPSLFLALHGDLVNLVESLPQAAKQGKTQVVLQALLGLWPDQIAWTRAVRHRVAMSEAGTRQKDPGQGWERILKERKDSLVLTKDEQGGWRTRKGGSLMQVLAASTYSRRQAIKALTRLPGIQSVELPRHLKFTVLSATVRELGRMLRSDHPVVAQALGEGRTWRFAVRHIRSMGFKGCFDPATQTVIVDPRCLESAAHELCHWLLGHEVQWSSEEAFERSEGEVEVLLEEFRQTKP